MLPRLAVVAALALAPAAFATGERITLTGQGEQLRDTLCLSMSCVTAGPRDFTVSARPVNGALEVTVTSSSGQHRLTHRAPLNEDGLVSTTDLVRATSLVLSAIERGPVSRPAAPRQVVSLGKKVRRGGWLVRR